MKQNSECPILLIRIHMHTDMTVLSICFYLFAVGFKLMTIHTILDRMNIAPAS